MEKEKTEERKEKENTAAEFSRFQKTKLGRFLAELGKIWRREDRPKE
jgi:hypothetical protein